jgi:subtilisin family serine protease
MAKSRRSEKSRRKDKKPRTSTVPDQAVGDKFARTFAPPELYDPKKRTEWKLEEEPGGRGPYVVELNLQHIEGLPGAIATLRDLHAKFITGAPDPTPISKTYFRCRLNLAEWQTLLREDEKQAVKAAAGQKTESMRFRAIYKLWPDFPVQCQVYRSLPTIKANAARRSFEAEGDGIVWAVIDSGIDKTHGHFAAHNTLEAAEVKNLHRCFVDVVEELAPGVPLQPKALDDPDAPDLTREERSARIEAHCRHALVDEFGHGTHVAGIIAGTAPRQDATQICTLERVDRMNAQGQLERGTSSVGSFRDATRIHGVAPRSQIISLRVLDGKGEGRSSDVIRALEFVREKLNDNPKLLRVHGVNLSVGYEFDAEMFACGQSPICAEVNRLVQSGVVVVAAAGNTGYGTVAASARASKVGLSNTINDPGNAELAITVGATHRDAPYMYGVSYFSSKGPTGDGRLKPDLVAPGERITSCAAGARKASAIASAGDVAIPPAGTTFAYYMEDSGTSMAAPHVSGAIAAFLSIRREFIGRPLDVKRIFTSTASPLGRERYFEGHGLVDLIRAIQSV